MPLPEWLAEKSRLKAYHYLSADCGWVYGRYTDPENIKEAVPGEDAWLFIFHATCENKNGAEFPRAIRNKQEGSLACSGCSQDIPDAVNSQATIIWLMERTKYA